MAVVPGRRSVDAVVWLRVAPARDWAGPGHSECYPVLGQAAELNEKRAMLPLDGGE
jgi:hypothetical protein